MADSFTSHLNLTLPEVGASRNSWGTKLNADLVTLDSQTFARMPAGAIVDFAGPSVPNGWLLADGREVSRTTYAQLFAALGATWGAGDGSNTFNLPDLRGRISIGVGTGTDTVGAARAFALAQKFGQWAVQLVAAHLPNISVSAIGGHVHPANTDTQGSHAHTGRTDTTGNHIHTIAMQNVPSVIDGGSSATLPGGGGVPFTSNGAGDHSHVLTIDAAGAHQHNVGIGFAGDHSHTLGGGDAVHENTPPVTGLNKIIFTGVVAPGVVLSALDAERAGLLAGSPLGHAA